MSNFIVNILGGKQLKNEKYVDTYQGFSTQNFNVVNPFNYSELRKK